MKQQDRPIEIEGFEQPVTISVSVVLDRSGSMESNTQETIDCYNKYIDSLKEDKKADYRISLTQFWSGGVGGITPEVLSVYSDIPLSEVPIMKPKDYRPGGGTPLNDCLGDAITTLEAKRQENAPVLMVVITDGDENSSRKYNTGQIKKMISARQESGWTFVFLGADIDTFAASANYGIAQKNVANYDKSNYGAMAQTLGANTMSYAGQRTNTMRAARASGGIGGQSVSKAMSQAPEESFFSEADRDALIDKSKKKNGKP